MQRPFFMQQPGGDRAAQEDLFFGQVVLIVARWFLICGGTVLALWTASDAASVTLPIALMVALMGMNFYLHGRYLVRQPANAGLTLLSGAVDLGSICLIVGFWTHGQGAGLHSPFFVFYYPTLLALALVFPPRVSLPCAALTLAAYLLIAVSGAHVDTLPAQKTLVERLLTMGATAGLGAYFWRIQRGRRAVAAQGHDALLREVEALAVSRGAVGA